MKKIYLKQYKIERVKNLKNEHFIKVYFTVRKTNTTTKNLLDLKLKSIGWSSLYCSSKEINAFHGPLLMCSGNSLSGLNSLFKSQKRIFGKENELEKNCLGFQINKILYRKKRLPELLIKRGKGENIRFVIEKNIKLTKQLDPINLISQNILKPIHTTPVNMIKTMNRTAKRLIFILDQKRQKI